MKKKRVNITSTVPVILLLGGKGSRFSELDQYPKQLVNLNKHNLLSSIFLYYKKYNLNYFILPLGHKAEFFKKFFNKKKICKKYKFNILKSKKDIVKTNYINIKLFDSRKNITKSQRIYESLKYIKTNFFLVTYGDGLADINFNKQLNFFYKSKKNILTTFKIRSQYGHVRSTNNNIVLNFEEKPKLKLPINIGYYIFKKKDFIKIYKKNLELESHLLPILSKKRKLISYNHNGFFFNIDNKKDLIDVKIKYKGI